MPEGGFGGGAGGLEMFDLLPDQGSYFPLTPPPVPSDGGFASALPFLQSGALLANLIGTAGQTKAGVDAANARAAIARMEAASIQQKAAFDEQQSRRRTLFLMGKTRAITAAGGVALDRGSPLVTDLDNTRQAEIEALNIRRTGELGAQSRDYEATLSKLSIPGTILAGAAHGTGTILSSLLTPTRYPNLTLKAS